MVPIILMKIEKMKKFKILKILILILTVAFISLSSITDNNVYAERHIDSPYGPVKPLDFDMYEEYYAGRSFIEYEGSEFGSGVVTDLTFSLTEENLGIKSGTTNSLSENFQHYCGPCHGNTGNGEGQFKAAGVKPEPVNFTDTVYMANLSTANISTVITGGSQAAGKSNLCPPWGLTFSKVWIDDMSNYIKSLSIIETVKADEVVAGEAVESVEGGDEEGVSIWRWIILGLATIFFVGIAVLEWSWLMKS